MGIFSKIFGGRAVKAAANTSFLQTYSEGSGGWGLERFNSVIDAYSSVDDMIEEWGLDQENCEYMSLDGYDNPWDQAYEEEYEKAEKFIEILEELTFFIDIDIPDPEDIIDWDVVEEKAYNYATDLANAWLDGSEWIPEEIMDWAWYDLSSHNM